MWKLLLQYEFALGCHRVWRLPSHIFLTHARTEGVFCAFLGRVHMPHARTRATHPAAYAAPKFGNFLDWS